MAGFVGRQAQLGSLDRLLRRVRDGIGQPTPGRALLMRGRRRVGKSRLVEVFVERSGAPSVWFTASRQGAAEELRLFTAEVAASDLPDAGAFAEVGPTTWDAALRLLADALPPDHPSIVVLDEVPYLMDADGGFEGTLQKAWDRHLSRRPVLLVLIGSDLSMMEALDAYGRPFHQRGTEMVVPPLSPAEVADLCGLEPADAFDAFLVTGGLPLVAAEWPAGSGLWGYLEEALAEPTSALIVSAERALAAELPAEAQARRVLTAVGAGERTFANIARAAGDLQQASLNRSLGVLVTKRVVAVDRPLSTRPSRETRYRVADPYLRFWLPFVGPHLPEIERGRGGRVVDRVRASWTSWRGRAIEPVVRESIERLPPDRRPPGAQVVGAYWTRANDVEIDLVGGDRGPVADRLGFVGSIKWLEQRPFGAADLAALTRHRARLPGADGDLPLVAVSRSGCTVSGDLTHYDPAALLSAWR